MRHQARQTRGRVPEQGAALVVGLVLLLVMTVLGISTMNTSTLEVLMAGNAANEQQAFQAAETGIDIEMEEQPWTTSESPPPYGPETLADGSTTEAVITGPHCTFVPGRAYSTGEGTGGVGAYHFDIVATGKAPRGAKSTHTQSFFVPGPGCP